MPDLRDHRDSYTDFIGLYVGAYGYHRLRTALGAYSRSLITAMSLSFNSFSRSLFLICKDLVSHGNHSVLSILFNLFLPWISACLKGPHRASTLCHHHRPLPMAIEYSLGLTTLTKSLWIILLENPTYSF